MGTATQARSTARRAAAAGRMRDRAERRSPVRRPNSSRAGRRGSWAVHLAQLLLGLALLGLWQLAAVQQWFEPALAKSPGQAWEYLRSAWSSGEVPANLNSTMIAVLIAWVLAGAAGVVVGVALGLLPSLERVVAPYFDAANAMPRLALAPLFIVVFGITTTAKVALAVTLVFFIVCSSARAGVKSTDDEWLRLAAVMDAGKIQIFWRILLPVATPAIFSGLRLGLIYSLLGVVGSELISARDGLGQLIAVYSAQFRMEAVYAILILLAVVAVLLNQAMSLVEKYLLRWQAPARR
ncbi:ABC transporter permease [Amycolatopsis rubida]|uniref:NitT/TauT family transport system permease protein n=1 Tax=Amycolatopsis rubida TaxID=112413 RepID=A0A1I5ZH19_9PSEU|nr:ABC transporter permease [Amycolatopsis rubida]SFQ55653.1 NitT/TauT family transport system permease protein [Amycolatopsis rubida]